MDSRVKQLDGVSPTVSVKWHKGTADTPLVCVPYTLKVRTGCAVDSAGKAAGKGALIQVDKAATLAVAQDQYLFQPVIVQSGGFKANQGAKAGNIGWQDETACTLNADRAGLEPTVCYTTYDARGNGDGKTVNTITGDHENRITDYTSVVCFAMQAIGQYKESEQASCLKERDYKDSTDLVCETEGSVDIRYIVRRLTPTECARLQGFADNWGHPDKKDDFTDEEYRFWLDVRNTHAKINGRDVKEYTKPQMLTWYSKLHTDSAEYKMWGNGIALPPALYCMQGIVDALDSEAAETWMT